MPLRDFICDRCQKKTEMYYPSTTEPVTGTCACGGILRMAERSNEGSGHVTHVRIK